MSKSRTAEAQRARVARNRKHIYDYLIEHPCVDCGEEDPVVLEFDHIEEKTAEVSSLVRRGASIKRIDEEIGRCEVRCANCHRKVTANDQGWWVFQEHYLRKP